MSEEKVFSIHPSDFPQRLNEAVSHVSVRFLYMNYRLDHREEDNEPGAEVCDVVIHFHPLFSFLRPFSIISDDDLFCRLLISFSEGEGGTVCRVDAYDWALDTWNNPLNKKLIIKPLINQLFKNLSQ